MDIKTPQNEKIMGMQGQKMTLEKAAYKMGRKVVGQKYRFCDKHPNGPTEPGEVLHVIDLSSYIPVNSHSLYKSSFMKGVRDEGYYGKGIEFLTD
jgi:hypothetical protein